MSPETAAAPESTDTHSYNVLLLLCWTRLGDNEHVVNTALLRHRNWHAEGELRHGSQHQNLFSLHRKSWFSIEKFELSCSSEVVLHLSTWFVNIFDTHYVQFNDVDSIMSESLFYIEWFLHDLGLESDLILFF